MFWFIKHAQELLSPPHCTFCDAPLRERAYWCTSCTRKITPVISTELKLTDTKSLTVYAGAAYTDQFKKLVMYKHTGSVTGCYPLAHVILEHTPFKNLPCDYLVPIPLHWTRQISRGFNQAEYISQLLVSRKKSDDANPLALSSVEGCERKEPKLCPLLHRTRMTKFQASLSVGQRKENVKDAFALTVKQKDLLHYTNKHIILIDDLLTTGNTLIAAAKALQPLKPASLCAIVACRAV